MKIQMIACDNPTCVSTAEPEGGGTPYSWLEIDGAIVGPGPTFKIEVCSSECIGEAVDFAILRHHQGEQEQLDEWARRFEEILMSIPCPRCEVVGGMPCRTKHNTISQQSHAARRDVAHRMMSD